MGAARSSSIGTSTPPSMLGAVRRPRLHERLANACADVPLVALVAGAGFGKTTVLASWASEARREADVIWIDAGDAARSSDGLVGTLRYALDLDGQRLPPTAAARVRGGRTEPSGPVQRPEADRRGRIVILDDLQDTGTRHTVSAIDRLVGGTPSGATLVLAARCELLRLSAARAEGRVAEIGADELAMDADEIRSVFAAGGISLEDQQVDHLVELTHGWPVAVRLACSAVVSGADPVDGRSPEVAIGRAVRRYLDDEVFTHLPDAWRDILACTSILDPIHADLARTLSGNDLAPAVLDSVATSTGLFTPAAETPGWVRPHPLAQAYLHTTLQAGGPQRVRDLHLGAAGWFTDRGDVARALAHAVRSRDEQTIRGTVERTGLAPLLCSEEHSIRLAREIALAPPSVWPNGRPLVLAVAVLASADPPAALALLDTVDPTAMRDDADRRLWAVARCKVLRNQGRQEDARAALATASWQGAQPTEIALRDSEYALTGVSGETDDQMTRRAEQALMLAQSVGAERPTLQLRVALGVLGLGRGQPRDAQGHARAALELGRRFGPEVGLELEEARVVCLAAAIELGEARADHGCGRSTRAWSTLGAPVHLLVAGAVTDLHQRWRAGDPPRPLLDQLSLVLGSVDLDTVHPGILFPAAVLELRLAEASQDLQRVHHAAARLPTGLRDSAEAHVLRAEEQRVRRAYRPAREELRPIIAGEVPTIWGSTRLSALVLDGVLVHQSGDAENPSLAEAVEVASSTGRRGPFIDLGAVMCEALVAYRAVLPAHGGFVEELLEDLRERGPARLPEPLTRAEMRVLHHLASMSTLQEIAAGMHLSRNTVKTHAAAVYRKLGVPNRRGAVARARELGLL